jgi:anthranilate synthase component 2
MILLIDNYDSFTYNLLHYLQEAGAEVKVVRNDAITMEEIAAQKPAGILISPGPGTPDDAGICLEVLEQFQETIPIFGVCLGHQSIGQAFGGKIIRGEVPMHGKVSEVMHHGQMMFDGIPSPFQATRYHSLIIDPANLPACLTVTAETADGTIMAVQHQELPIFGVQFHPESIASEHGHRMLANFLKVCDR